MNTPPVAASRHSACLVLVFALVPCLLAAAEDGTPGLAGQVIERTGVSQGICAVLGWEGGTLPLDLAESGRFLVHVVEPDPATVSAARKTLADKGLSIDRIIVEQGAFEQLPYATDLIDLVVTRGPEMPSQEAERVIHPGGAAVAVVPGKKPGKWTVVVKPVQIGRGDWSHWEHAPDNNAVSTDTIIRAPYMTQWLGLPYYICMPAITTVANGRVFTASGHIAHHRREEVWLNTLLARNGYNGRELWRRKLPDGYLAHRSAYVATADTFYMIQDDGFGLLMLDPDTGDDKGRIRIPDAPGDWKWIAIEDGTLYTLIGAEKDPPETTIVRSQNRAWSWGELSEGYYAERVPWGFGQTLLAYSLDRKKVLWTHREEADIDSRGMTMGDGHLYFYAPDARAACLNAASGNVVWANGDPDLRRLIEEKGRGLTSTPGFRTTCLAVYTPKAIIYQGQTRANVVALTPDEGQFMWTRKKTSNNPNAIYVDDRVYVGIGPDGETLAVDPLTGETLDELGFMKRSCVRLTATSDSLFCRGWPEGVTRYDRATGQIQFNGAVRPACNDGVIGANGLLYIGPWTCDCNLSLMGTLALCSAEADAPTPEGSALEVMAENPADVARLPVTVNDWPVYRAGIAHNAASPSSVGAGLAPLWVFRPERPFHGTPPTAAGGLIFLCSEDGHVRAIDAATGIQQWCFATAGPILQPPTIWEGRAYVGSGDGYIYALEAATGRLLWRYRAAPIERRMMLYGALSSTWPVNSGILVQDGVAYAAAGVIDFDGTYVHALDAVTGEVKWVNDSSGHLDQELRKGVSAQGNLTIARGRLWMAGGNVISPAPYDLGTGEYVGIPVGDGSPAAQRGEEIGLFADKYLVFGGRLRYSARENVVNPGSFQIATHDANKRGVASMDLCGGKIMPAWDDSRIVLVTDRAAQPACYDVHAVVRRLKGGDKQVRPARLWSAARLRNANTVALALAEDAAVAAFETAVPRNLATRWQVAVLDRDTGNVRSIQNLPGPAIANGVVIDRDGRIIVALADGSLACFGGGKSFEACVTSLIRIAKESSDQRPQIVGQLRGILNSTSDIATRKKLISGLADLGVDLLAAARDAGCVTDWRLIGPVPWDGDNPVDKKLVGEPKVDVTGPCKVGGETLEWREFVTDNPNGTVNLVPVYGELANKAVYAYGEITVPEARELNLSIGSNDGFKCWLNGKEVSRFDGGRSYAPDQTVCPVKAKKGINTVLLKVTQMGGAWAFSARLVDG